MAIRALLLCLASSRASEVYHELISENFFPYAWTVINANEVRIVPAGLSDASRFTSVQPGLTGEDGTISFLWRGRANHYLQSNGANHAIGVQRGVNDSAFNASATFHVRDKLATTVVGRSSLSFESVQTPGSFIRHVGFRLQLSSLSPDSNLDDRLDASFWGRPFVADSIKRAPPSSPQVMYNERGLAWTVPTSGGAATATSLLAGGGTELVLHQPEENNYVTYTFELAKKPPGEFLRRSESSSEVVASRSGGSLRSDASFNRVSALSGNANFVSYESAGSPGHYLVYRDGKLRVEPVAAAGRELKVGATTVRVGATIALHNKEHNRFVRVDGRDEATLDHPRMDGSEKKNADALPASWAWERFTVVDAGNGEVALHNAALNRFIRIDGRQNGQDHPRMDGSEKMDADALPAGWSWERFELVDAGNGEVALHNRKLNRFVRLDGREDAQAHPRMDASGSMNADALPGAWSWERFTVVEVSPPPSNAELLKDASWQTVSADSKHRICEIHTCDAPASSTSGRRALAATLAEWMARESAVADRFDRH